jgi:exonuclease III
MAQELLKIVTFNCKNAKSSLLEIRDLCNNYDVILLQELWLLPHEINILSSISNNFMYRACSAIDVQNEIIGRPFGGVAVLWKKDKFDCVNTQIVCDRLIVFVGLCQGQKINICNVYCPTANLDVDSKLSYLEYLGELSHAISLLSGDVIVMGDFNASCNNGYLEYVTNFCEEENLYLLDEKLLDVSTYTYEHVGRGVRSWIDHIIVSNNAIHHVKGCYVLYNFITSDHFPLVLEIMWNESKNHIMHNVAIEGCKKKYLWKELSSVQLEDCRHDIACKMLDYKPCCHGDVAKCVANPCRDCVMLF